MSWKVDHQYNPQTQTISLFIRKWATKGTFHAVQKLEMKIIDAAPGTLLQEVPMLEMPDEDARAFLQAMMEAAWELGLKPRNIGPMENELVATKYHLEDMRKIALSKYET